MNILSVLIIIINIQLYPSQPNRFWCTHWIKRSPQTLGHNESPHPLRPTQLLLFSPRHTNWVLLVPRWKRRGHYSSQKTVPLSWIYEIKGCLGVQSIKPHALLGILSVLSIYTSKSSPFRSNYLLSHESLGIVISIILLFHPFQNNWVFLSNNNAKIKYLHVSYEIFTGIGLYCLREYRLIFRLSYTN